jgi:hypothetical protein
LQNKFPPVILRFPDPKSQIIGKLLNSTQFVGGQRITFGTHQDRETLTQCGRCFRFGHQLNRCSLPTLCQFCGSKDHVGNKHSQNCSCTPCKSEHPDALRCDKLRCPLCLRDGHHARFTQCPERLEAITKLKGSDSDFKTVSFKNSAKPRAGPSSSQAKGKGRASVNRFNSLSLEQLSGGGDESEPLSGLDQNMRSETEECV